MAQLTQRELDLVSTAAFIKWMNDAFASKDNANPILKKSVVDFTDAYARIIKSYEEEIEWLKSAANVGNDTPTPSPRVLAESAEGQLNFGEKLLTN